MNKKPIIYFVDPDKGPNEKYFVKPLQVALPDYEVIQIQSADAVLSLLKQPDLEQPALVLHEIALLPPQEWQINPPFNLDDGLLTGVALIAEWQKRFKGLTIACLTMCEESRSDLAGRDIAIPIIQKMENGHETTLHATTRVIGDVKKLLRLSS